MQLARVHGTMQDGLLHIIHNNQECGLWTNSDKVLFVDASVNMNKECFRNLGHYVIAPHTITRFMRGR